MASLQAVCSLYRSYIRQIRGLPHFYLRQFFGLKVRDDTKKVLSFKAPSLRTRNMKTISKALKRIRKASQGDLQSFQHLLALAYGRKGKLKWELLEPFMFPTGPVPHTIISGKESSGPPIFSPGLVTLLTSPHSRTTRPLNSISPRDLPARANPLSEDARIYGRFSKRREVNIRWRQFRAETKKLLPPLGTCIGNSVIEDGRAQSGTLNTALENMEGVVGRLYRGPTETRRERKDNKEMEESASSYRHPSRWIRRRYRWLLSRSPRLVYRSDNSFCVQISRLAFSPYQKTAAYMAEIDPTATTWFQKPAIIQSQNQASR